MNKFSKHYKDSQNRSSWISNKIDKLVSEGKPQDQAVAIAHSMWNSRKADGGSFYGDKPLKKMQPGGQYGMLPGNPYDPNTQTQTASNGEEGRYTFPYQEYQTELKDDTGLYPTYDNVDKERYNQIIGLQPAQLRTDPNAGVQPPAQKENVTETPEFQKWAAENLDVANQYTDPYGFDGEKGQTFDSKNPEGLDMNEFNRTIRVATEGVNIYEDTTPKEAKTQEQPPVNPYASADLNSSFYNLGQAVEKGDALGIAGFGAKSLLASGRNFLSGMGQARTSQDIAEQRREELQESASGVNRRVYVEDGGQYNEYAYGGEKKMYQQGGEVDQDKILTGEVLTGVSGQNQTVQPNTEIEDGEYVLSNDGQSIKVEGKKHSQGGEDVELQDGDKVISDNLKLKGPNAKAVRDKFGVKVKAKDTYATVVDKVYKDIGLDKLIKEEEQVISKIRNQEEKLGEGATKDLNLQLLYNKKQKIEEQKQKLEEIRQQVLNEVYNMQEASKPKEEASEQEMKKGGEYEKMQPGGDKQTEQDFSDENEKIYLGLSEALKEVPEGQSLSEVEGYELYGDVTKGELLNTIQKNPWYDFTDFKPTKESTLNFQKEYNKRVDDGAKLVEDGKFGEQTASAYLPWVIEPGEKIDDSGVEGLNMGEFNETMKVATEGVNTYQTTKSNGEVAEGNGEEGKDKGKFQGYQGRPDQSVLPPSGVDAQTKITTRYDRVDPALMSPDQIIQENNRKASAAIQAANQLPDAQRAAAIAQITAQTQAANQNAISQYDMQNNQILNNAQATNAQIQMNEENMAGQNALSFEKRQQTAESITDENVRQFLDFNRKVNVQNFNDTRRQNTLNRAFENFDLDAQGNIINSGGLDADYMTYLMAQNGQLPSVSAPKKKTTKKKS